MSILWYSIPEDTWSSYLWRRASHLACQWIISVIFEKVPKGLTDLMGNNLCLGSNFLGCSPFSIFPGKTLSGWLCVCVRHLTRLCRSHSKHRESHVRCRAVKIFLFSGIVENCQWERQQSIVLHLTSASPWSTWLWSWSWRVWQGSWMEIWASPTARARAQVIESKSGRQRTKNTVQHGHHLTNWICMIVWWYEWYAFRHRLLHVFVVVTFSHWASSPSHFFMLLYLVEPPSLIFHRMSNAQLQEAANDSSFTISSFNILNTSLENLVYLCLFWIFIFCVPFWGLRLGGWDCSTQKQNTMQENLTPHACAVTDRTFSFSDVPSALERLAKKSPSSKLLLKRSQMGGCSH